MSRLFSNIFLPDKRSYNYDTSRDSVRARIAEVLSKGGGFLTEPDLHGYFYETFSFRIIVQPAYFTVGEKFLSTVLDATILETATGQSVVKIQVFPCVLFKFLLVFILAIGAACIYHSIRQLSLWMFIAGVGMLLSTLLVNIMAGLSKTVIEDRYERYIHKTVKSVTSA